MKCIQCFAALLLLLANDDSIAAFSPSRLPANGIRSAVPALHLSATVESDRLNKARQLLQDLSSSDGLPTSTASEPVTTDTTVVPDTFFRNGHLLAGQKNSDYVTRWAAGVKVAEPLVKYDPIATEKKLFRQPTKWLARNFQIALPMGLWAVGVASDFLAGRSKEKRRERARQLTAAISSLGPAIIKGGQALAVSQRTVLFSYHTV